MCIRDSQPTGRLTLIVDALAKAIGPRANHVPRRADIGDRLVAEARAGDRILIMGARDDTLSRFAADILERLDG